MLVTLIETQSDGHMRGPRHQAIHRPTFQGEPWLGRGFLVCLPEGESRFSTLGQDNDCKHYSSFPAAITHTRRFIHTLRSRALPGAGTGVHSTEPLPVENHARRPVAFANVPERHPVETRSGFRKGASDRRAAQGGDSGQRVRWEDEGRPQRGGFKKARDRETEEECLNMSSYTSLVYFSMVTICGKVCS